MRRNHRRKDATRGNISNATPVVEPTAAEYDAAKAHALRCILAALELDEAARQHALIREFLAIEQATPGLLFGVLGYLLRHVTEALERGHGGHPQAVDEVMAELARVKLGADGPAS